MVVSGLELKEKAKETYVEQRGYLGQLNYFGWYSNTIMMDAMTLWVCQNP